MSNKEERALDGDQVVAIDTSTGRKGTIKLTVGGTKYVNEGWFDVDAEKTTVVSLTTGDSVSSLALVLPKDIRAGAYPLSINSKPGASVAWKTAGQWVAAQVVSGTLNITELNRPEHTFTATVTALVPESGQGIPTFDSGTLNSHG